MLLYTDRIHRKLEKPGNQGRILAGPGKPGKP